MERTYTTSELAGIIGIHPNTVRLYEELHLITAPERKPNGYRIFTDLHLDQFINARLAFQVEILQNGLRRLAVDIVRATAECDFDKAIHLSQTYCRQIETETGHAEEAIGIVKDMLAGRDEGTGRDEGAGTLCLGRSETAAYLGITIDTLRNWELNGLLRIKRKKNGYRIYTDADIRRLKIIRSLRCANYSLTAILRMLTALSADPDTDIRAVIDAADETVITACDNLLSSLSRAAANADRIHHNLCRMKEKYHLNPPL
ncbi:MerR family transcriptional regulator [Enterocloster sp. OA13]|uniref:MerR family transcriptional regulator n=1 Tax=Enterocloster sp. OA13 TaxID=2914161 RepID=UPI0004709ABE|nr:MerR family transcriptional regulator [Enterocloster sp. OA13]